jgi:hypothetical protein
MTRPQPETRESLMVEHRAAIQRRAAAALGSHEYQQAAEDVARIEVAIARIEEPPVELLGKRPDASRPES